MRSLEFGVRPLDPWTLGTWALLLAMGCSSPIVLAPPLPTDGDAGTVAPTDASVGLDATADAMPSRPPPPPDDAVCGFRFERRAPRYTHVWASSPSELWMVQNQRQVYRTTGGETTRVPLPDAIEAEEHWINRMEGVHGDGPWLLIGRLVTPTTRHFSLIRWAEGAWEPIELPASLERPRSGIFVDLVVFGRNDIWASASGRGSLSVATVFHWDGDSWTPHTLDDGAWPFALAPVGDHEVALAYRRPGEIPYTAFARGSVEGWRPLSPEPEYITTSWGKPVVFHAESRDQELFVDAVGRFWARDQWWWTHVSDGDEWWARVSSIGNSHHSVLGVGHYDGAFWIVKKRVAVRLPDPSQPLEFTVHELPFEATDVTFPAEGPPWVVGSSRAFWNGAEWEARGETAPHLYNTFLAASGVSSDDYWLSTSSGAVHVHDGITEHRAGPPECGDAVLGSMFALSTDDLFFNTCNGVQRFFGGRWRDVVLESGRHPATIGGIDESTLFAFRWDETYRFEYDRFEPQGAASWSPDSIRPMRWELPTPVVSDDESVYAGMLTGDDYHEQIARFSDGRWAALPPLPGSSESAGMYGKPWVTRMYAGDLGQLWAVGFARTQPSYSQTRVFSFDGDAWSYADLSHPNTLSWQRYIDGRGDQLWVVASDRIIWRRRTDGEWERDDRCVDAPELSGVAFQGVWFPPDGGAPKVFGSGGNILAYQEELR